VPPSEHYLVEATRRPQGQAALAGGAGEAVLPWKSCVQAAAAVRPEDAREEQVQQVQEGHGDGQRSGSRRRVSEYARHGDGGRADEYRGG
jgi:hypothetical protein